MPARLQTHAKTIRRTTLESIINVHGLPGRNIPAYLHMEHLNRVCKEAIRGLGVNKTDKAIVRVGKSLGTLCPVLDQFDKDNHVPDHSTVHSSPAALKDRDTLISQLQNSNIFSTINPNRLHPTFPRPRNVMQL